MLNIGSFGKSIIAMIIFVLFYLISNTIGRHTATAPESIIAYYITAAAFGIVAWFFATGQVELLKITKPLMIVFLLGATLGAMANIYLIQAVIEADNPGVPSIIIGSCGAFVYLIGIFLAIFMPKYFKYMEINANDSLGVLLILAGMVIIFLKR